MLTSFPRSGRDGNVSGQSVVLVWEIRFRVKTSHYLSYLINKTGHIKDILQKVYGPVEDRLS